MQCLVISQGAMQSQIACSNCLLFKQTGVLPFDFSEQIDTQKQAAGALDPSHCKISCVAAKWAEWEILVTAVT